VEGERLVASLSRSGLIARIDRHHRGAVQSSCAHGGRRGVECEEPLDPRKAFAKMTAHVPEPVERACKPERQLRLASCLEAVEGGAEVVMLGLETVEPAFRLSGEMRIGRLR